MRRGDLASRDWFGKSSAAVVLGFTLAIALTCTFAVLFSDGDSYLMAQGQLAMWLISPIWCLILGFCFLFRSGPQAWARLGAANLVAWVLYAAVRGMAG